MEGRARWNKPAIMTSISPKVGSPRSVRKRFTSPTMQLSSLVPSWACHFSASSTMKVHSEEGGDGIITYTPQRSAGRPVFLPEPENCRELPLSLSRAGKGSQHFLQLITKPKSASCRRRWPSANSNCILRARTTRGLRQGAQGAGPRFTARAPNAFLSLNPFTPGAGSGEEDGSVSHRDLLQGASQSEGFRHLLSFSRSIFCKLSVAPAGLQLGTVKGGNPVRPLESALP